MQETTSCVKQDGPISLKYQRFIVVGDNHGDMQDSKACDAMFEFAKSWKPTIRVHLGDCFDFRCFRRSASDEEKRDGISDDIDAGIAFMEKFKPTHYLRGNHCERLHDVLNCDDDKLIGFAARVAREIKSSLGDAMVYPYNKRTGILRLGHLKIIHGYHSGITAARMAAQIWGSVLMGHIHTIDQFSIPGLERRIGRSIGCLCKLDQDYNRAQANTLRQAHGWGYGLLLPGGDYQYWQAEKVAGQFFYPSEVRSV